MTTFPIILVVLSLAITAVSIYCVNDTGCHGC